MTRQGTQSQLGCRFVTTILTVRAPLRKQHRSILDFITQACRARQLYTSPKRTMSLFNRGIHWYPYLTTMHREWFNQLMTAYEWMLREHQSLAEILKYSAPRERENARTRERENARTRELRGCIRRAT